MRLRGTRIRAKTLAGLYRRGSRGGCKRIQQSRTHARCVARWVAGRHRGLIRTEKEWRKDHGGIHAAFRSRRGALFSWHRLVAWRQLSCAVLWRGAPLFVLHKTRRGCGLHDCRRYLILLTGVSFASSEEVLPPGGWKYFCEIDCHIAHSLAGAQTAAALGPEMQQVAAHGKFVIVRVKTWL